MRRTRDMFFVPNMFHSIFRLKRSEILVVAVPVGMWWVRAWCLAGGIEEVGTSYQVFNWWSVYLEYFIRLRVSARSYGAIKLYGSATCCLKTCFYTCGKFRNIFLSSLWLIPKERSPHVILGPIWLAVVFRRLRIRDARVNTIIEARMIL